MGVFVFAAVGAGTTPVLAQVTIPQEYEKTVKATQVVGALGADLFGENVSLYTGATSFSATDVSLAGSSALPVEIRRRYVVESRDLTERNRLLTRDGGFADWELDLPFLQGVFAKGKGWQVDGWNAAGKDARCSLSAANLPEPPVVGGSPGGFWAASEYWQGNHLHIPGGGEQEMLVIAPENTQFPTDGKTYVWVTNDRWYFSCLATTANATGEGFLAIDPGGNRYWFNWFASRDTGIITKSSSGPIDARSAGASAMAPAPTGTALQREEVRIFPTRVEDRFGNAVVYTYDSAHPWRLSSIVASDGRSLNLSYDAAGHISSVTDGTRTWTYAYGNGLTEVRLPDQSKWVIDFSALRAAFTTPNTVGGLMCSVSEAANIQPAFTGTLVHPSGARGDFSFRSHRHGRSYVPKVCIYPAAPDQTIDYAKVPFLFNTMGIAEKKLSGPGIPAPLVWTYAYGAPNNSWEANCAAGCIQTKTTEVSGPESEWNRYTFGNRYVSNEGKLLKVETGTGPASVLHVEETTYQLTTTGQPYPARVGWSPYSRGDHMSERLTPVLQRTVLRQGTAFTRTVNSYDAFARPTNVTKSSAPVP